MGVDGSHLWPADARGFPQALSRCLNRSLMSWVRLPRRRLEMPSYSIVPVEPGDQTPDHGCVGDGLAERQGGNSRSLVRRPSLRKGPEQRGESLAALLSRGSIDASTSDDAGRTAL